MMVQGTDGHLVARLKTSHEFLGMAGLHDISASEPETGIWIREGKQYPDEIAGENGLWPPACWMTPINIV
jgi:hypothetical protein